ncbi:phosphoribosylanthranilate isomerase [Candidatus Vidania fulgoroideorum]
MHITKIKICGIKDLKSLNICLKNRVDGVGFVIYKKSSRNLSIKKTRKLINRTPNNIIKFLVIKDLSKEKLRNIFKNINFDFLQFYGKRNKKTAKRLCLKNKVDFLNVYDEKSIIKKNKKYSLFSIEAKENLGKGKKIDFNNKAINKKIKKNKKKIMISGGINFKNVYYIVRKYKPYFVDISSGVEYKKKKNKKLIKMIINEVHLANFVNVFQ